VLDCAIKGSASLLAGEFSASIHVSTVMSIASRYQTYIRHVPSASIMPSDFASRNAPECDDMSCQMCSFVHRKEDSGVRHV
jgi:hypothetical protein